MNREQIVKALECCTAKPRAECGKCPYFLGNGRCKHAKMQSDALSLIREMEIELEAMRTAANSLKMHYEKLTEENDRLRADTVRKMQERLRQCFDNTSDRMAVYPEEQVLFAIDQIAKETLAKEHDRQSVSQSTDVCVSCGAVIPEGRQVCPNCQGGNNE